MIKNILKTLPLLLIIWACDNENNTNNTPVKIEADLIIRNGNVLDVNEGIILEGYDVFIKDDKVVEVAKNSGEALMDGEIDATGKYITPGLIDSHVHWANFAPDAASMQNFAQSYLESGVTTVREMGGDTRLIKEYHKFIENGEFSGPTVYYCSFWAGQEYFDMLGTNDPTDVPWNRAVGEDSDFATFIKDAQDDGAIALKLYHSISAETLNKIVAECEKVGMRTWAHFCIEPATTEDVVAAGVQVVSHAYLADNNKFFYQENYLDIAFSEEEVASRAQVFKAMAQKGIIYDLTLKHNVENGMSHTLNYAKEALANDVRVVAGTDWGYFHDDGSISCAFLDEIEIYQKDLLMSPLEVIRSATTTGAEILGMKDKLGIIAKGAEADILILDSNPLESVAAFRNIETKIVNGKLISYKNTML